MTDLVPILGALGVLLSTLGAGVKVVYDRLTRRIDALDAEVKAVRKDAEECKRREAAMSATMSQVLGWIGLVLAELRRIDPANHVAHHISAALARAYPLTRTPADLIDMTDRLDEQ